MDRKRMHEGVSVQHLHKCKAQITFVSYFFVATKAGMTGLANVVGRFSKAFSGHVMNALNRDLACPLGPKFMNVIETLPSGLFYTTLKRKNECIFCLKLYSFSNCICQIAFFELNI